MPPPASNSSPRNAGECISALQLLDRSPEQRRLQDLRANEWASLSVRQQKRALDSALPRFRLLTKDDRLFALRSARELLR